MNRELRHLVACILALCTVGCASTGQQQNIDVLAYEVLIEEARFHEKNGMTQDAITTYLSAISLLADSETWYRVGVLHLQQQEEYPAMAAFEQAIVLDEQFALGFEEIGLLALHWKQIKKAEVALRNANLLDSTSWRSINALAMIADLNRRHDLAMKHYHAALELNPESPDILNNLGYSQFLAGQSQEAKELLVRAVSADRDHRVAWNNLAKVMAKEGRYADAFNILERNLTTAAAYHDVGYIALLNGDYVRAEDYMSKALHASPSYFDEAFRNRTAARNRLIGNNEGLYVVRRNSDNPYCTGLRGNSC